MIEQQTGEESRASESAEQTPIKVKKIGHVVYRVSDMQRSVTFWTGIMGFKVSDVNDRGMYFLRCASDHHTIALAEAAPGGSLPKGPSDLIVEHWAMEVESVEALFRIRDFLKAKGVPIYYEGRRGPGCNIGIEFFDPDGYLIELYADMEQIGWDGKSRPSQMWRRARSLEEAVENPVPNA